MYNTNNLHSNKAVQILHLIQLTKPKIVVLLAITGGVAFLLPNSGSYSYVDLMIYLVCGYFAAGGAMAVNNAIDYDIDSMMERTRSRVSTGQMSRTEVTVFGSSLLFLGLLGGYFYFGFYTSLYLAWGGLFYIFAYSLFLKRSTWTNTIFGGLASPAPVWGAYAARYEITGVLPQSHFLAVPLEGWLLGLLVFLWTPTHTWAMAVKNYDDYCNAKVPMLPVLIGIRATALVNLIVGTFVIVFAIYLVMLLQPAMILLMFVLSAVFLYSLIRFLFNPTVREGTVNFHAHNIWLGLTFLLLLL